MSEQELRTIRLPPDAIVVLAGPSGSGKTSWAARWFRPSQVVSSDAMRGVVGEHEHDLRASSDAFDVVDIVVERRAARGLFTVIDTLGMDIERHERWQRIAGAHRRPIHLVCFDEDPKVCRRRNASRPAAVPSRVLTAQLEKWDEVKGDLGAGFDAVHAAGPAAIVPPALLPNGSTGSAVRLEFGLLISAFDWPGSTEGMAEGLRRIAGEAEVAGFTSLWVMDHFMQIPQVGREWEPMLESYTALGHLAAVTERITLGTLVSGITHRNLAHLGKTVATLDVLSGGRARCGLGVAWYEREHIAHGYSFPSTAERYELLEDALEFLPVYWGPGALAFEGRRFSTPEAICYPRPIQERIPILVGGSGERRTLRLVARYADACNLFGEPDVVSGKVAVLHQHCADVGRDPADVEVTQLSALLAAPDHASLQARLTEALPSAETPDSYAVRVNAGTHEQHIDRFGRLAEAGVQTVIVSLADVGYEGSVEGFAPIIDQLSGT